MILSGVVGLRGWVRWRGGAGIAWKLRTDDMLFSQRVGETRFYLVGPFRVWTLKRSA